MVVMIEFLKSGNSLYMKFFAKNKQLERNYHTSRESNTSRLSWSNYRMGINSDRHVRHPIQDIFAHYFISPQPGFSTLSGGILPYFQYQTRNKFTSW
jgi:hypothetical protein